MPGSPLHFHTTLWLASGQCADQPVESLSKQLAPGANNFLQGLPAPGLQPPHLQFLAPNMAASIPCWGLHTMSPPQWCLDSSPSSTQPSTTWWRCMMATPSTPGSSAPSRAPTQVPRAKPALGMVVGWGHHGPTKGNRPYKLGHRWNHTTLFLSCAGAISTTRQSAPRSPNMEGSFRSYPHPELCLHRCPQVVSIPLLIYSWPIMFL